MKQTEEESSLGSLPRYERFARERIWQSVRIETRDSLHDQQNICSSRISKFALGVGVGE